MPTITSAKPCTRPTTNWTATGNARLEKWFREGNTKMAIEVFLHRNTVGWGRLWYTDSVSGLAKKLGRSKSLVREKLDQMVADGEVLRKKRGRGFYDLALAELEQEKGTPKPPDEDGGKLAPRAVDNSDPAAKGPDAESGKPDSGVRDPGLTESGKPDSVSAQVSEDHSGIAPPKQRQTKTNKQNLLLKPSPAPTTTVENSPEEGSKPALPKVLLDEHKISYAEIVEGAPQRSPQWLHNPSLEQMTSEPECVPVRVKSLRGFPNREEVRQERRMEYEAFEELWHRELNYKREHAALQSYVWHTFTAEETRYLIKACRHARNLYGYANKVVRAMEMGISGPRRR